MVALLSLLPCAVVVIAVMAFRLSGLAAAGLAFGTAAALWVFGIFSPAKAEHLWHAVADSLILELLVGVVIFCGLLFVEVSSRSGALGALSGIIKSLRLATPRAVILIALGVGVMLESLTGYGVSMLVTVPLLLQIVDRTKAICLALIGMSLMSWGALSVSALLGAELSGLSTEALADSIIATSGPIAAILPLFCLLFVQGVGPRDVVYALLSGVILTTGIFVTSHWIGVEVAGVGGGLAVIVFSLVFAASSRNLGRTLAEPAILPYGLLIVGIVLQKLTVPHLTALGITPAIATDRVSFRVLDSPGIALFVISLVLLATRPALLRDGETTSLFRHVANRSWRSLASIFLFLLTARILVEVGGISALAETLTGIGQYPAVILITVLGGVGAYVTGSGVTSNALFMPSAAATGESFDSLALFAALQHSGSAHVAMASLPVIAILLAALPNRVKSDERTAMRMGLGFAALWTLIVIASGSLQLRMSI
jgi:lactate permease